MEETDTWGSMEVVSEIVEKALMDATWELYYESVRNAEDDATLRCPRCGSFHGHWRGYRKTDKRGTIHRRKCSDCALWHGVRWHDMS